MLSVLISSVAADDVGTLPTRNGFCVAILEVIDEGSWSGKLTVWGRPLTEATQRAEFSVAEMVSKLAVKNLSTGDTISGATGITTAGLYSVDLTGLEALVEHTTHTAGTVSVDAVIIRDLSPSVVV